MEEKKIKVLLANVSPRPTHNTGKALKDAKALGPRLVEEARKRLATL